jgi:hypothetical protein
MGLFVGVGLEARLGIPARGYVTLPECRGLVQMPSLSSDVNARGRHPPPASEPAPRAGDDLTLRILDGTSLSWSRGLR